MQQTSAFLVAEVGRFKTWADLEKAAMTERLRVAITGFGSDDDVAVNFLAKKGLRLASVPMPKPGERYASILGGHTEVLYEQIGDVRSFVDGKQMKPIVFFSDKRDAGFPDVPTATEVGYKVSLPQFRSIIVRSGTDAGIVKKLAEALADAIGDPEYVAFLKDEYADPDSFVPAVGAGSFLDNLLKATKQLIANSGVTQDTAQPEPKK
jgi:tripartite-type tricarboxylate transporter receptor subunit TctC